MAEIEVVTKLPVLPPRSADSHKGSFGKVLIVAGSRGMSGAAILCGLGALRGGAGLVQIATPAEVLPVLAAHNPCYLTAALPQDSAGRLSLAAEEVVLELARDSSVLAIGPGLGQSDAIAHLIKSVVNRSAVPVIIDADGLNALARTEDWPSFLPPKTILTPHDGEAARLAGRVVPTGAQRVAFAERYAALWKANLVLKGAVTIITDGKRTFVHDTPNPTLGVGGSGDALGGAVAAFAARGLAPLAAAAAAVWVHGRAGALLAGEVGESGALATDIVDALPRALREILAVGRVSALRAAKR